MKEALKMRKERERGGEISASRRQESWRGFITGSHVWNLKYVRLLILTRGKAKATGVNWLGSVTDNFGRGFGGAKDDYDKWGPDLEGKVVSGSLESGRVVKMKLLMWGLM